jgi:hypothetical protein
MKKILFIALIAASFSSAVLADRDRLERRQDYQYRPHPDARWHSDAGWLIPAIIGGVLIYGAVNSQPRPPVVVQPPPQYYPIEPNQPQQPPIGYHWEQILDGNCNCYRVVLVGNR